MKIEEGMILLQETSDKILMDLRGNTKSIGTHIEHWLVRDIRPNKITLYNLSTGHLWKLDNERLALMLKGNKRLGIKPMFTISEERG